LTCFSAAAALAQTSESIATRGVGFLESGNSAAAEREFAAVLKIDPNRSDVQNLMGIALDQQGKHSQAQVHFREAIRLQPNFAAAHANLAMSAVSGKDYPLAVREYREALTLNPAPANADAVYYNLALALYKLDHFDESLSAMQRISNASSHDDAYFALRGSDYLKTGRLQPALTDLQTATKEAPENPDYLYDLAITLIQSSRGPEAIRLLTQFTAKFPRSAKIYAALGVAYYATGDNLLAQQNYLAATRVDPDAADLRAALGDLFSAVADYRKAALEYEEACRLDPKSTSYLLKKGQNWVKLQQNSKAKTAFRQALAIDGRISEAYFDLGKIATHEQENHAAVELFEKAANLDPENSTYVYGLGLAYRRVGEMQKADFAMNRFRKLKPN
jgi:Flp pilus assembly protein TadD